MKRIVFGFGALLLALCGQAGLLSSQAAAQDVNNFTISHFDVDYYLGQDGAGHSTLKTVEKITAVFPQYDQNHGIERAVPEEYDGHSTSLKISSVTDETGHALQYSEDSSNDNLVLRIGNPDTYAHGEKTYVITYTQRDVTKFFENTNDDEFYWDVNGTQWAQSMTKVSARVHVAPPLDQKLNNRLSCYQGAQGSTTQCELSRRAIDGEVVLSAEATNLKPNENMTVAIGFASHTFTEYQPTWQEELITVLAGVWLILLGIGSIVAVVAIIWMSVRYYKIMHRAKGRGTIVPEYLPPKDTSVLLSAQVLKNATSDITAQLIDLAVRHYIKIYEIKEKTFFKPAQYKLEIVKKIDALQPEERRLLEDLFGKDTSVGSQFNMKDIQRIAAKRKKLLSGRKAIQKAARGKYGLYERATPEAGRFKGIGIVALILGIITLSPLVIIAAVIAFIFAHTLWPLTTKGVTLHEYLQGLREYIGVAEKDRIKMLQSPQGAEKVGVKISGEDPKQLVKLYERVLPYAVLFGVEKQWSKQLGTYYETADTQPNWYVGQTVFNAAVFSSSLSGFSSQSSTYSGSTNASSGGSGGGGFSGGGGGGGGGGGW